MEVGEVRPAESADFDRLLELASESETENNGWELAVKKGKQSQLIVHTRSNEVSETFKMIRAITIFPDVSAPIVYNVLHDGEYRIKWEKNMVEAKEICVIDPENDIGYYQIKTPGPLKNRDFVTQRSWHQRNGCYMIMNHSVYHKSEPPRPNVIRGISYYTGWVVETLTDSSCKVSYITQSNPGGNLPIWLVNKLTTIIVPKITKRLYKACKGYPSWKKSHNPNYMPWIWPDQINAEPIDWDDVENTGQENGAADVAENLDGLNSSSVDLELYNGAENGAEDEDSDS